MSQAAGLARVIRYNCAWAGAGPLPDWVKVNVWPAIVSVPARLVLALLEPTLRSTKPLPVPLAPDWMVTKAALLDAVQLHEGAVVTDTEISPPPEPIDCEAEL